MEKETIRIILNTIKDRMADSEKRMEKTDNEFSKFYHRGRIDALSFAAELMGTIL